jgi:hypothetical protein
MTGTVASRLLRTRPVAPLPLAGGFSLETEASSSRTRSRTPLKQIDAEPCALVRKMLFSTVPMDAEGCTAASLAGQMF